MKKSLLLSILLFVFVSLMRAEDLRSDTIDIRTYLLNLDLSNFTTKILYGDVTVGCKAKMNGVNGIRLDLQQLTVDTVNVDGYNVPYNYNDSILDIDLLNTFNAGDSFTVRIVYHGHPLQMIGDFGGFYWTNIYAFNIGVSFLADPHNYGRVWFPCFDNFRERSLFEYFITTKNTHKAFCNGILQGVTTAGTKKTWHWKFNQEIPSYLASVAVSDYQTLMDTVQGIGGVKEIQLAARASDTTNMKNLFVHLHDAFHIQEELWGEYKWDRVGYCIVPFNAGAMEHATNISFMQSYLNAYSAECENTMVHELSHHWFGDLVTCDSASEMWLNEGWAVYNEMLFHERFYGTDNYKQRVRENHEYVLHRSHVRDGGYLPVSGVPTANTYGSTVYDKGSDVIHTLRSYMGDSLFFHCVKDFISDYSWNTISTAQLRDYLSSCSGINLNDYFNNWVYAEGFPHFSVEGFINEHDGADGGITKIFIRQRLNHAPQFYHHVSITVSAFTQKGYRTDVPVVIDGECGYAEAGLNGRDATVFVAVDFDEKLQDAITDEWKMISDTGSFDFGTAKLILNVKANVDSSLIRVEHNWIRPEPMKTKVPSLHLHDKRYWTVDGIIHPNFIANARVNYDGTDVSLDAPFISNSEDSLVVMWRADADSEWASADSFSISKQGSATDKKGYATIYNLKKGQYCFAIWNSSITDTTTAESDCVYSSVSEIASTENDFQVFPNPASEIVTVTFEKNVFRKIELNDLLGKKFLEQKISEEQMAMDLKLKNISTGTYLITLSDNEGNRITKKIMKQ